MKNDLDNNTEVAPSITSRRNFIGAAGATVAMDCNNNPRRNQLEGLWRASCAFMTMAIRAF
jgi:hypothetical protein